MGIGLGALRWLVRSRRARWMTAGGAVLVVLLASVGAYALTRAEPPSTGRPATAAVDRGEVLLAVATTGELRPAQTRSLGFGAPGTVAEVRVRPGDQVRSGQVLALIDDADAQDRVTDAQDALDQAESARDAAEQDQETRTAGADCGGAGGGTGGAGGGAAVASTPSPGPTTASPTPSQPGRPSPTASSSHAGPTHPSGTGPGGNPAGAGPGHDGGAACAARAGQPAGTGTDPLLRAQQRVTDAGLTLAQAQDALAGTKITAPIAGKVLSVAGEVGSAVSGGTFITLADVGGMQVAASFPEADAGRLAVGLTATVTLADRPGAEFPAKVTQVDPVGTATGQMVKYGVLLDFTKVPTEALVGQTASVRVKIQSVPDALRVPSTAVHGDAGSTGTVLVRTVAGGSEQRQVAVGLRGDQYTEITSGLTAGDQVVANW